MNIIELVFNLSIVYVIYNLVWWIIVKLPKGFITGFHKNVPLDYVLSALKFLVLSNITFTNCLNHIQNISANVYDIFTSYIIGGLFLFIYMASKLNKNRSLFNLATNFGFKSKFNFNSTDSNKLKYENHIIGVSMVVFTACIGFPRFGEIVYLNPLNIWFNETIQGLYQAPILKSIFGFFGFFFMVSTFQKGISSIKVIIHKISGKSNQKRNENPMEEKMRKFTEKNSGENSSEKVEIDDDLYVDYEEMEDNEN